jgi:hypothetical protein
MKRIPWDNEKLISIVINDVRAFRDSINDPWNKVAELYNAASLQNRNGHQCAAQYSTLVYRGKAPQGNPFLLRGEPPLRREPQTPHTVHPVDKAAGALAELVRHLVRHELEQQNADAKNIKRILLNADRGLDDRIRRVVRQMFE